MLKKGRFWFLIGVCLALFWGCVVEQKVDSFASAERYLQEKLLPKISVATSLIPDRVASRYTIDGIQEPLPPIEQFPLYAAQPSTNPKVVYLEIFSSSEKANIKKQNEGWLVEVAQAFNRERKTISSGQVIQVGVRKIPSGTAAKLLAAGKVTPTGYSPSNDLWVAMLSSQGIKTISILPRLVPNVGGFVLQERVYRELAANGEVNFDKLLNAIASGKLSVGYPNPYSSATALNLLYSLFWRAAGHQQDGEPLTIADLESPQVKSVFQSFQKQVLITTTTTLDLQEIFIRDKDKLQAFPLEYQNYQQLKKVPGFEKTVFIPFGIPHNNPLVGFAWNTAKQQEALQKFAEFAASDAMKKLAQQQGFVETDYLLAPNLPPIPAGEVLTTAQSFWKRQKDAGRTVYLMTVIDTSGSMEGQPLAKVKEGLRIASQEINPGNYLGLISYNERPSEMVELAPFDEMQHKRFLAAIDNLRADGGTAMYDGMMVALGKLLEQKKANPNGLFYILVLTDGKTNEGFVFAEVKDVLQYSGVRVYPIAYGDVNQQELAVIAALRESTVKTGTPETVKELLKGLFQTNL
ncbi:MULTISPECIES: VWA domain-containing protein [Okeania]|uniref:VWA domain-containing protein n=1 Tax=Okeania TaxID=1458928 RepID=UPI000F54BEBB|nr:MULTISPECIES: VWA domain-containing protein [Okeania]NES88798.1 VWA domain-containing protein [Okeania sp. SIO2B9]NET75323.1 VWA domain-containing protein [Okeania sp. SIO1F9]RQH20519.1 VWA domain-containing protein [Okeania hirsuta]